MEKITLKNKAKDNHGYEYETYLVRDFNYSQGKLSLVFDNAPSGWHVSALRKHGTRDKLAIDLGKDWFCINIRDIMAEIEGMF